MNSHHLFPVFLRVCRGAVGHHPSLSVTTDHTERTKQSEEAYGCARTRPAARGVEKKTERLFTRRQQGRREPNSERGIHVPRCSILSTMASHGHKRRQEWQVGAGGKDRGREAGLRRERERDRQAAIISQSQCAIYRQHLDGRTRCRARVETKRANTEPK